MVTLIFYKYAIQKCENENPDLKLRVKYNFCIYIFSSLSNIINKKLKANNSFYYYYCYLLL